MSIHESAKDAVSAYFEEKLTPEVKHAQRSAMVSLYGFYEDDEDPPLLGFSTAIKVLTNWWGDVGNDVWYDVQSGNVFDKEPKGYEEETGEIDENGCSVMKWTEPFWEDYMHYGSLDAKCAFFGSELTPYV